MTARSESAGRALSPPRLPAASAATADDSDSLPRGQRASSRPGRAPTRSMDHNARTHNAAASPSQTRTESVPGSRAPLLRQPEKPGHSTQNRSEGNGHTAPKQNGYGHDDKLKSPPPVGSNGANGAQWDLEKAERNLEREREEEERRVAAESRSKFIVRLARHFGGVRGDKGLPTPLIRPLRHLSPDIETYILTFLGTFGSILIACGVSYALSLISSSDGVAAFDAIPLTVGSFGASAVLLYATPESPLSQPRNVIGGQTFSAIAGSVISQLFALNGKFTAGLNSRQDNTVASPGSWPSLVPLSGAFSVGIATLTMQLTGTVHPPGGATALIAAYHRTSGPRWTYVLDVFLSITAMTIWAFIVNNLGRRRYPTFWWKPNKPAPPPPAQPAPPAEPEKSAAGSASGHHPAPHPGALRSRTRSGVSSRLDPAVDLDPADGLADGDEGDDAASGSGSRSLALSRSRSREDEVFSPMESAERRWLGRLGEEDEEALAGRDEQARREAAEWEKKYGAD